MHLFIVYPGVVTFEDLTVMAELRATGAWNTCWSWSFVVDKLPEDGTSVSKRVGVGT